MLTAVRRPITGAKRRKSCPITFSRIKRVRRPIFAPVRERQPTTSRRCPLSGPLSASNSKSPGPPRGVPGPVPPRKPRHHNTRDPPDPPRHTVPTTRHLPHRPHPITKALRLSSLIFFRRRREWKKNQASRRTGATSQLSLTHFIFVD